MSVNISYSLAGLHEASRFIWENNPSIQKWPSKPTSVFGVMDNILSMMRKSALRNADVIRKEKELKIELSEDWISFTGTGGYYLSYEFLNADDEEINIGVTILVDPAVGNPNPGFVTEELDETEKEV